MSTTMWKDLRRADTGLKVVERILHRFVADNCTERSSLFDRRVCHNFLWCFLI